MLKKEKISSSQLMFLIAGIIQGTIFPSGAIEAIAKHDTWLAVLATIVIYIPVIWIYVGLLQQYPGKNLIQINDIVYGPYLGKLISMLYIFFYFLVLTGNTYYVSEYMLTEMIPETPKVVILIMFIFICAWAVRKGLEVIARTSFALVAMTVMIVMLTFVLLLKDMKLSNFLPVFEVPLKVFIHGMHLTAAYPLGSIVFLLMIIPDLNKLKQAKSAILLGLIIGGVTMLGIVVQNTAVLGPVSSIASNPSIETVRLIDIADVFTRLEVLFVIVMLFMVFLKVSIFYYIMVLGMAQLLGLRSYLPLVLPIGIICVSVSVLMFDAPVDNLGAYTWPAWSFLFQVLLPLVSLILAKIRRLPKKQGG